MTCFIIAEVGVNHDGSLEKAIDLTRAAAEAGVDAVKFQYFNARTQAKGDEALYNLLGPLEMTLADMERLHGVCARAGVEFMCTAFCEATLAEIAPMVKRIKVGSGQVRLNDSFLRAVGDCKKPVILSNGMCADGDIRWALQLTGDEATILSCISEYPVKEPSLKDFFRLRKNFPRNKIGFSDHSGNLWVSVAAAAAGASVVEAHITHDRAAPGPDHSSSLEVGELACWVREIRNVASASPAI